MKIGLALRCLLIALIAFLHSAIQVGAQEDSESQRSFPYQALVSQKDASVLSGPASVHYTTEKMKQGSVVEVYRHDPGGWCAIRPPRGSFSLLPQSAISSVDGDVGVVNEDGIKAWVGTRLGIVDKPLWQVKLKKDERVHILGEVSWPHPDGHSTIWYQIAPPAGEFRWIKQSSIQPPKFVSDLPELLGNDTNVERIRSNILTSQNDMQSTSFQSEDPVLDDSPNLDPPSASDGTVNRGWRQARAPIHVADRRGDITASSEPFKIPAIESPAIAEPMKTVLPISNNTSMGNLAISNSSSIKANNISPLLGPVSARIRSLESSLSVEMLKNPPQWELESILRQATSIASNSNQATEQQHAQRLVAKIRKCVAIQSRFDSAYNNQRTTRPTGTGVARQQAVGASIDNNVEFGTTYDAHGWLNQLVRGKGSLQPTYVLEDDTGKILYHLGAAPGLNLNRYLKNKVGVIGRRGYHRDLQLDHVTAERIVVIDSLRR